MIPPNSKINRRARLAGFPKLTRPEFGAAPAGSSLRGIALAMLVSTTAEGAIWTFHNPDATEPTAYNASDALPSGAPPASSDFPGVVFSGRYANYTKGDTWYPTWAADGNLYSPWTDGSIDGTEAWSGRGANAVTGYAKIAGDDPLNLTILSVGTRVASALPYQGRYPCGSLHYNGVWYYGTYGIDQTNGAVSSKFGWYNLGPLVGFSWSTDNGATWQETPHTPANPLFPEVSRNQLNLDDGQDGPFTKMGAPHFVDFGRNMEHSPDGKAYLVGHGARIPDSKPRVANNSWVTGDAVYMARVTPSVQNMNDASAYEYFAGRKSNGDPIWASKFADIEPVFEWNNHCGIVTATYNPGLDRFFMCITDGHRKTTSRREYTSYILEAEQLTGPWKITAHMVDFGPQAYFLNIPSKFISADGQTMWLCYSANYMEGSLRNTPSYVAQTTPPGSAYSLSLHEFRVMDGEAPSPNPMTWPSPPILEEPTSTTTTCATASDPDGVEYYFEEFDEISYSSSPCSAAKASAPALSTPGQRNHEVH